MGKYEHSNETFRAVPPCGTVYCIAVQGGPNALKLLNSEHSDERVAPVCGTV